MQPQERNWDNYNVVLITLDSCRFDSAALASTPYLDRLGPLRRAITPGTFTLPAHMAFFSGYLPNVVDLPLIDYYSRERFQLWRLSRAKQKPSNTYAMVLQGDTITEGFRNRGFDVIGAGGTRWFLTSTLQGLFDEFSFWGPRDYSDWFAIRKPEDFALNHQDELTARLRSDRRWFLFVNSLETHAPYNNGVDPPSDAVHRVIECAEPIWAGRKLRSLETTVSAADYAELHRAQVRAVEVVDDRLGQLFARLPKPFIAVVCGDHGECLGEGGQWGHGFPDPAVTEVPMWVGLVE
jgi:sulfatase-like protein